MIGDVGFDYLDGLIKKVIVLDIFVLFVVNLEVVYMLNVDKVLDIVFELIDDLKKVNV